MDMSILLNAATLLVAIICGWFLKSYFPKYMEEKGKNLATKEDIGEITTIIESVKTQLARDTEVLKADLSLKNQNLFSIKTEERKALIDFHTKYSAWVSSITNSNLTGYDLSNYLEMNNIGKYINERKMNYELAEGLITLFMHDDDFMMLKKKIVVGAIEMEHINSKYCIELKGLFALSNLKINSTPIENQGDIYKEMYDKSFKILSDFQREQLEKHAILQPDWANMTKLIKQRVEKTIV